MNREDYERDLARRQKEHLDRIRPFGTGTGLSNWQPCLHDSCPECVGTGVKHDGSPCIHMISCPCPKCSPRSMCCAV